MAQLPGNNGLEQFHYQASGYELSHLRDYGVGNSGTLFDVGPEQVLPWIGSGWPSGYLGHEPGSDELVPAATMRDWPSLHATCTATNLTSAAGPSLGTADAMGLGTSPSLGERGALASSTHSAAPVQEHVQVPTNQAVDHKTRVSSLSSVALAAAVSPVVTESAGSRTAALPKLPLPELPAPQALGAGTGRNAECRRLREALEHARNDGNRPDAIHGWLGEVVESLSPEQRHQLFTACRRPSARPGMSTLKSRQSANSRCSMAWKTLESIFGATACTNFRLPCLFATGCAGPKAAPRRKFSSSSLPPTGSNVASVSPNSTTRLCASSTTAAAAAATAAATAATPAAAAALSTSSTPTVPASRTIRSASDPGSLALEYGRRYGGVDMQSGTQPAPGLRPACHCLQHSLSPSTVERAKQLELDVPVLTGLVGLFAENREMLRQMASELGVEADVEVVQPMRYSAATLEELQETCRQNVP